MIHTLGAKTLNDAVELVSILGESTNQNAPSSSPSNQNAPFSASSADQNAQYSVSSNQNVPLSLGSTNQAKATKTTQKENKRREVVFIKPLLLCQGITESLKKLVLCEVDVTSINQADLLMLAVHALITETSLLLKVRNNFHCQKGKVINLC